MLPDVSIYDKLMVLNMVLSAFDGSSYIACQPRAAEASDLEALLALADQLGYPSPSTDFQARLAAVLERDDHALFVVEDGLGVCGFVHASVQFDLVSRQAVHINALVVDERARNFKLGERLLQAVEAWSCKRGCDRLSVHSNVIRDRAHNFYRRLGFAEVKEQKYFEKRLV